MNIIYSSYSLTLLILFLSLFGIILAFFTYIYKFQNLIFFKTFLEQKSSFVLEKILNIKLYLYLIFISKWFFDKFYNHIVVHGINFMYVIYSILDKGFFEYVGPFGASCLSTFLSLRLLKSNQGFVLQYFMLMYYGSFFITSFFFLLILL
jgi:hypothetical protein